MPAPWTDSRAHLTRPARGPDYASQREAVELTTAANPTVVVSSLGDFGWPQPALSRPARRAGACLPRALFIGVLGNHDHWAGADEVAAALKSRRRRGAAHDNTIITIRRQRLQIVASTNAYTDMPGSKGPCPACAAIFLRWPCPTSPKRPTALETWHPLVLAGHTHGGQITVARLNEIAVGKIGGHKYVHGCMARASRKARWVDARVRGGWHGASVIPIRIGERGKRESHHLRVLVAGRVSSRNRIASRSPWPVAHYHRESCAAGRKGRTRRARRSLRTTIEFRHF